MHPHRPARPVSPADRHGYTHGMGRYGEGSVRPLAAGGWVAAAYIDLPSGRKRVYRRRTRAEAVAALDDARRLASAHVHLNAAGLTTGDWLDEWRARLGEHHRPRTVAIYGAAIDLRIVPVIGGTLLHRLTPVDVRRMQSRALASGSSPRTVAIAHGVLRSALNAAMSDGLVDRNVAMLVRPPAVARRELVILDADQARALLDATAAHRLAATYAVAIGTGLRQGEQLGLRWPDVDLDARTLAVHASLSRRDIDGERVYVLDEPKTSRSRRTVALPPFVVESLREHRRRQLAERLAAGDKWGDHDLVFTTRRGEPISGSVLTHELADACKAAGLPRVRWHDLRHVAASLMLGAGVPMAVVSRQLGHASIAITVDTYGHVTPDVAMGAADAVERVLGR